ncbi:metallophosphoesterase family protein [Candidatus Formimonas warabiya]|uniref:Calcineurin-like phosphoesterase domain-containing protein n=1 Tax=Formimonas warabiya TaxID=1761012 RepID=A0A3G1KWC7_FORW1|nr:metallophosphoesterase [Candidatus Formimonas warabiya]ATW26505.1 hypothetical protein DCMF_18675 [Candidatus Formimonas warabiya]
MRPDQNLLRKACKAAGVLLTAGVGILVCLFLFGTTSFKVHDLTWKIFAVPSLQGQTVIEFPPFGNLSAQTHVSPLDLHIRLERVGPQLVQTKYLAKESQAQIVNDIQDSIPQVLVHFSLRQIGIGFFGAFLFVFFIWRLRFKPALGAGLLGALLMGACFLLGFFTFNTEAFQEPHYDGVISEAPNFIHLASLSASQIKNIQSQAGTLMENVEGMAASTESVANLGTLGKEGSVKKILLVSDLHSNPMGVELMKSLVKSFKIDFIIDAGDLTDFGSHLEIQTADEVSKLGIPYLFCPGNHETEEMVAYMKTLPNVVVLQGQTKTFQGIRILGIPDPLSSDPAVEIKDADAWAEVVNSTAENALETIQKEGRPDILVMHNPQISRKLAGSASLLISGHTHLQAREILKDGTLLINPGTTGAAGMRGLYAKNNIPYSAVILHYSTDQGAIATDFVQYDLASQNFSLKRHLEEGSNPERASVTTASKGQ